MNSNTLGIGVQSGIYQIRNTVNDKVYVGQSRNLVGRIRTHRRELLDGCHYNRYLQRSFDKYGPANFVFEVLEYCQPDELNERERHWIHVKESEYADTGYNAAYAYTLFQEYDKNRRVNKSRRTPAGGMKTEASKKKFRESIRKYYSDDKNRLRHSLRKSEINYETVVAIKTWLHDDLEVTSDEIANSLNVSAVSISHIRNLASHELIASELNYVIKNRMAIAEKRKDRVAIRLYSSGESYSEIAKAIGCHLRSAIRRVDRIKTEHDDRCRLNVINRAASKKASLVKTLCGMGYGSKEIVELLHSNRATISGVMRSGPRIFTDLNSTRGKAKPFAYKTRTPD